MFCHIALEHDLVRKFGRFAFRHQLWMVPLGSAAHISWIAERNCASSLERSLSDAVTVLQVVRAGVTLALSFLLSRRGIRNQSLNALGALAASVIAFSRSRATAKRQMDANYEIGNQRSR